MKFTLKAILKTLSPMHISSAGSFRLNIEKMTAERQSEKNSDWFPCNGIQRINMSGEYSVPVIPANNIAGRLRRHVAELVLKAATAQGKKVSLHAYSALMCGAVGSSPDKRALTYAEYKKSQDHPYIGLMGGGPRMLPRRVRVLNGLPLTDAVISTMENQMHPAASEHLQNNSIVQTWTCRHNDDLMELVNVPLQEASIENYVTEIQERQNAIIAEKAKGDRSKLSTFSFSALEFVVPGAHFNLGFELDVNEAQMGLFLMAIDSFASKERIGGQSRNGFGAFSLKEVILTATDEMTGIETVSTGIFNNGRLNQQDTMAQPLLSAWATAAGNMDVATLEEMMTLVDVPKTKEQTDAKKAEKKAAKALA